VAFDRYSGVRFCSRIPQPPVNSQEYPMTQQDIRGHKPARRGFAAMDKERQREIARKGGASVPDEKRSFSQDRDLAAAAGRKGGEASHGGGRRRAGEPRLGEART
jgi:general stress protein YciG